MFNRRLENFRNELGLFQKDMAKKLDITEAYYSMIENGGREPSKSIINKLVALSGKPEEYWLYGIEGKDYINSREDFKNLRVALNQMKDLGMIQDENDLKNLIEGKYEKGSAVEILLLAVVSDFGYILEQKNNKN